MMSDIVNLPRRRILVVAPNWVGDMVMAQSLFISLKQRYPNCQIDVLAPVWTAPLLYMMPEVTEAIVSPLQRGQLGIMKRYQFGRKLQKKNYDQAILLPNSFKSALIPFFAKIPRRTGFVGEQRWGVLNDVRHLNKKVLPMTVQRFVALGWDVVENKPDCPVPVFELNEQRLIAVCTKFSLAAATNKILALCPGAEYGPAKCWPAAYYAVCARDKLEQGWQVWLFGSANDQAIAAKINRGTGGLCRDLSGKTSLLEAVYLLSLCDVVVSNDSGLMHVAAALGKNLVAIYGSSDPGFTPPLNKEACIVYAGMDCSPCFKRQCPFGHYRCLQDLKPEEVLAKMDAF